MVYYDPRKPKPWPIRLLNKWGVTDDTRATNIVQAIAIIGMLMTVLFYANLFFPDDEDQLTPEELEIIQEMELDSQLYE